MEDLLQAKPAGANVTTSFVNDPNFINQYPDSYNHLSKYSSWNGDYLGYLQYMADHGDAGATDKVESKTSPKTQYLREPETLLSAPVAIESCVRSSHQLS